MKKISVTLIGLAAMLMLLAAPMVAGKASAMEHGGKKAKGSEKGGMTSAGEMTGHDAILASSLIDWDVQDAQGNKIGEVSDIMIGPDGNVEYIVLSQKDGFLGLGEKDLVPVPWSKVNTANIDKDQDAVTLSLSKQDLENAPSFNEAEWQAFLRGEKQQEVRGYFGTEDDARPSGQEQMMRDKTGQKSGMNTGDSYEKKNEETERKGGERKY